MTRLVLRDDETLELLVAGHRDAVAVLVDDLRGAGHDVEVMTRPAQTGVPMASGTFETIAISVISGVTTSVLNGIGTVVVRWASRRHRERLQQVTPDPQVVTEFTIYGPDGDIARHWLARGDDLPDE